MFDNNQKELRAAIIFSAIMVSIALLFNGFAYLKGGSSSGPSGSNLELEIKKGIEAYNKKLADDYKKAQEEANKPKKVTGDFTDTDAVLGSKDAKVTIIEWSDYECPYCKKYYTQTYSQIKKKYVDTGKVKIIFMIH